MAAARRGLAAAPAEPLACCGFMAAKGRVGCISLGQLGTGAAAGRGRRLGHTHIPGAVAGKHALLRIPCA